MNNDLHSDCSVTKSLRTGAGTATCAQRNGGLSPRHAHVRLGHSIECGVGIISDLPLWYVRRRCGGALLESLKQSLRTEKREVSSHYGPKPRWRYAILTGRRKLVLSRISYRVVEGAVMLSDCQ
jgi:hypothetical protein